MKRFLTIFLVTLTSLLVLGIVGYAAQVGQIADIKGKAKIFLI